MTHGDYVYTPRADVRYRIIGDEAVVVRQQAAEVVVLNEVAARVLQLLDARTSTGKLVERLQEEFAVEPEMLRRDVDGFLDELLAAGIIEAVASDSDGGAQP